MFLERKVRRDFLRKAQIMRGPGKVKLIPIELLSIDKHLIFLIGFLCFMVLFLNTEFYFLDFLLFCFLDTFLEQLSENSFAPEFLLNVCCLHPPAILIFIKNQQTPNRLVCLYIQFDIVRTKTFVFAQKVHGLFEG